MKLRGNSSRPISRTNTRCSPNCCYKATKNAQEFVTKLGQGYSIGKPELAPGYYEFMIQKDGKDYAELDVNGYTGQVWFENWNGPILNTVDVK